MKKIFLLLLVSTFSIEKALAIPPPDILMSTLQSVMQFFGIVVVFLISLFFLIKDFLKNIWLLHKKKCLIFGGLFLVLLLGLGMYFGKIL